MVVEEIKTAVRETVREEMRTNGKTRWISLVALLITGLTATAAIASQVYVTRFEYFEAQTKLIEKINDINTNVQVHIRSNHEDLASYPTDR